MSIRIYDARPILHRALARFRVNGCVATDVIRRFAQAGSSGGVGGSSCGTRSFDPAETDAALETDFLGLLNTVVTTEVEPDCWEINGGRSTIQGFDGLLIVRTSSIVHQRIEEFLRKIGEAQLN